MIYVFEDGRMLYDSQYLMPADVGKYVAVESLPPIEDREGYGSYYVANLEENKLEVVWVESIYIPDFNSYPEPFLENYQPTEGELIIIEAQAATLINQQEIISKQTEIDAVLAELLLNQQGV
ncbi:hypothetical protein [Anaerotignum sp.]|uniref:hypothetical protein n=1 Tax=Anaerotignum sp. TaxID=2039241 RepID=UPI002896447B|nr:hypothetical protein [Anaerotignum sp.]